MPESEIPVAPQPEAQAAQTSGEKNGPANLSGQVLAQKMFKKEVARQEAEKAAAEKAAVIPKNGISEDADNAAATGEAKADPAEVEPEDKPEAEKTAEAIPEEKPEDVLSPETQSLDPKLQEKINRRIGKEVAKRKDLERQINELRAQMLEVQQPKTQEKTSHQPIPSGSTPLANVDDVQSLVSLQQEAKEAIRFVEDQVEREDFPADGLVLDGKLYKKDDLRAIRRNAKITLEDHIPARYNFLTQRQQVQQTAYEKFPFLKDSSDPLYVEAKSILLNPSNAWLRGLPAAEFFVGAYVKGMQAIAAEEAAKKAVPKPNVVKSAKPSNSQIEVSADSTATRVPVTTQMSAQLKAASDKLKAKGGINGKEFAQLLSAKAQLRSQTR